MQLGSKVYFLTVAETKNITKAAQMLHISQPYLSQYLTRLEQELGVKLLDRNTTPLHLTEAGELYLEYVKKCVEVEEDFEKKLEGYKFQKEQTLTIGIPTQLTPLIFDSFVQDFLLNHPDIKLTIKDGTSNTIKNLLLLGDVDIAFFHTEETNDSRFIQHILHKENLFLACSKDSVLAKGQSGTRENPLVLTRKDFEALEKMRFLTLGKNHHLNDVLLQYIKRIGISPKRITEIPFLKSIINCILDPASDCISILVDFAIQDIDSPQKLTFIQIEEQELSWYLTMNRLENKPMTKMESVFWENAKKTDFKQPQY